MGTYAYEKCISLEICRCGERKREYEAATDPSVNRRRSFRPECLAQIESKVGESHPGQTKLETAELKADRIIAGEVSHLQWTRGDLLAQAKSHPAKVALAARLRQETTLSVKAIAGRLSLGKPPRVPERTCINSLIKPKPPNRKAHWNLMNEQKPGAFLRSEPADDPPKPLAGFVCPGHLRAGGRRGKVRAIHLP
jgi:hypothetical protein